MPGALLPYNFDLFDINQLTEPETTRLTEKNCCIIYNGRNKVFKILNISLLERMKNLCRVWARKEGGRERPLLRNYNINTVVVNNIQVKPGSRSSPRKKTE